MLISENVYDGKLNQSMATRFFFSFCLGKTYECMFSCMPMYISLNIHYIPFSYIDFSFILFLSYVLKRSEFFYIHIYTYTYTHTHVCIRYLLEAPMELLSSHWSAVFRQQCPLKNVAIYLINKTISKCVPSFALYFHRIIYINSLFYHRK